MKARDLGATGIGLCRTEHMFMEPSRLPVMQRMILETTLEARTARLDELLVFQREDFKGILAAMAGYPVTIRLLDPPLARVLAVSRRPAWSRRPNSSCTEGVDSARFRARDALLTRVRQLHEENPMLGLRVCRLGIVYPEIYAMQVRAIFEAACALRREGIDARPDVMIPGVGTREEMQFTADAARAVADEVIAREGVPVPYHVGTMIELPRACVVAGELAERAEFFSFGTNDLTQTTYGYSRDDADRSFIPVYLEKKILAESPFQVLDRVGVGGLHADGRRARPLGTKPTSRSGSAANTAGSRRASRFAKRSVSTTFRARRTASRSHALAAAQAALGAA